MRAALRSAARSAYYEVLLHSQRVRQPRRRPSVVVFPSNQPWDAASRLRAWEPAVALGQLGWRVVVVPEPLSLWQRRRILKLEKPDVVLLQQTRHELNRPHLYHPTPCVLDADDADYLDPRCHEDVARSAKDAAAVVGGSRFVAECLGRHNPDATVIWTATPVPASRPALRAGERGPIIAWAHASPLGYKAEADLVQEILIRLAERAQFEFWLFGTTEEAAKDYLQPIRATGATARAIGAMPYDEYLSKVAQAAIGLQPVCTDHGFSRGKSFGKVLAYLAGEVAVVASDEVDHPLFFEHGKTGMLPKDVEGWVDCLEQLLADPQRRSEMAALAYEQFEKRLSMPVFARQLDAVLRRACGLPFDPKHEGIRLP